MRLIFLFIFLIFQSNSALADSKILARVNDDIISQRDYDQRLELLNVTGQADPRQKEIRQQLLEQMIDEKLKMQEASRSGIAVSDTEVKQATTAMLKQNGIKIDELKIKMTAHGLPMSLFEDQIRSDMAFYRSVRKTAGQRTEPSETAVNAKYNEISAQMNEKQYLISEIVLPVPSADQDAAVYGQAMQLIMQMRDGADFENLARNYSKSTTAAQGGMVGWVPENALDRVIVEELEIMQPGQLSTPIKTATAYNVIALRSVRDPTQYKDQSGYSLAQIFIPSDTPMTKRTQILRDVNLTKGSCPQFVALSTQLRTSPQVELGVVPMPDLPAPIAQALDKVPLLTPTQPIKIDAGELILMACSKEKVSPLPTKEAIKTQMENRALETAAARRLRELRRDAITEIRQ